MSELTTAVVTTLGPSSVVRIVAYLNPVAGHGGSRVNMKTVIFNAETQPC